MGYEGMPVEWYLRSAREEGRFFRGESLVTATIPGG